LVITELACAITTNWSTNLSGSYTSAANWTAGVPTSADTAIFNRNLNIQYNVTFPGRPIVTPLTREVRQFTVGTNSIAFSDAVAFNQLPAALAIDATNTTGEGALMIGATSGQNAGLSTTLSSFSTSSETIGNTAGSSGGLSVNGGTFNVMGSQSSRDELIVGNHGSGTLNITGGADLSVPSGETVIGRHADSVGTATLSGAGSTWMNNALAVAHGTLTVTEGGALSSVSSIVDGSDPEVAITGNGSTWTSDSGVRIGYEIGGSLMIRDGGQVTSTGASVRGGSIFDLNGQQLIGVGSGVVEIDGVGTAWTNNGPLSIGLNDGGLSISDGAQVTSGTVAFGRTVLAQNPNDTSTIGLVEGSGSMWTINGDLNYGVWGTNTLGVRDGGKVAVTGAINLYNSGTIEGNGTLAGQVHNAGITFVLSDSQFQAGGNFRASMI
jgi:T5SS/PEP-CTERM-associated repeat protein